MKRPSLRILNEHNATREFIYYHLTLIIFVYATCFVVYSVFTFVIIFMNLMNVVLSQFDEQ